MSLDSNQYTLICSGLIMIGFLVSKSVMKAVGNNTGKDCPHFAGPIIACVLYGIAFLMLCVMTWTAWKNRMSMFRIGTSVLLLLLVLGTAIAYIPFIVQRKDDSDKTECVKTANKDAIEYMELIMVGFLSIFLITAPFTASLTATIPAA